MESGCHCLRVKRSTTSVHDAVYRIRHTCWNDEVVFGDDGSFKRRGTPCCGRWVIDGRGMLTLEWKQWKPETATWNGTTFAGRNMILEVNEHSPSLWALLHRRPAKPRLSSLRRGAGTINLGDNAWVMTTPNQAGRDRLAKFYHQFLMEGAPLPREYTCIDSRRMFKAFDLDIKEYMYKKTVFGLMVSRYGLVSMAKSLGLPYIVTYENDVVLCEDFWARAHEFLSILKENAIPFDSVRFGWLATPGCRQNMPPARTAADRHGRTISYHDLGSDSFHLPGNLIGLTMASAYDRILDSFHEKRYILSRELAERQICPPGGSDNWLAHPVNGTTLCPMVSMAGHDPKSTL